MLGVKMKVDDYIANVIGRGDEGSELLAKLTAPTLKNSELVDILQEGMNGIAVLRIPQDKKGIVHSIGGDPKIRDLAAYTASMVDRLVKLAKDLDSTPVGFANVIDSKEGKRRDLEIIGRTLAKKADEHKIPILNGELAILGDRVNCVANIMGTMISITDKNNHIGSFNHFASFDPKGKAVYINSDGIGTKTEFYERAEKFHLGLGDSLAMKLDDSAKIGATAMVVSDVVETKGKIPFSEIHDHALKLGEEIGVRYLIWQEKVGDRIRGYNDSAASYNVSGSVVSVIDEERLRNPLKPSAGESLVVIRGKSNPRSNGITDKRGMTVNLFGVDWHKTPEGIIFLEYLAQPSTILYLVFKKLIDDNVATSVYHMSGGAFNGKLARPLAKHGLFIELKNLFKPDYRELALAGAGFTPAKVAYEKWPMGNDGFVSTNDPDKAIKIIEEMGLEAHIAGMLERTDRTGVELTALNGEKVYFPGK
jgi:phosphoribosylaminoimidazole (AIR) synthetase